MKKKLLALVFCVLSSTAFSQSACTGHFPNLLTDIDYDGMFPITLAGGLINLGVSSIDYDSDASKSPICLCANSLMIGIPTSFWEPIFMFDQSPKVGCMPLLGGIDISPPYNASENGTISNPNKAIGGTTRSSFMHINQYINPVMSTLGVVPDSPCLDKRGFDSPYLSWADPTWNSDALSNFLTPYSFAFANIISAASEAPDAIKATFGFPFQTLFWTAGAWGPMYPVTGNVATANTPEQVSHLLMARVLAKMHAVGTVQSTAGQDALASCGALGVPQFLMDKRQYKTNRMLPFPDNMITPISRPLILQEKGAAFAPYGKDYGYMVFRKKDCCAGIPFKKIAGGG